MVAVAEQVLEHINSHVQMLNSMHALADFAAKIIGQLLRRDEDAALRDKTLARVSVFFEAGGDDVAAARNFTIEAIGIVLQLRHSRGALQIGGDEIAEIYARLEEEGTGPLRGQATEPTRIIAVPPPEPEKHEDFAAALGAALRQRVGISVTFFQRWNPRVFRRLPQPFLLAKPFGAALDRIIEQEIVPLMLESRTVRHLGTLHRWAEIDSAAFWPLVEKENHMEALAKSWAQAWDEFRPKRVKQATATGEKTVLRATPRLKYLRQALSSEQYALPEIRSREIDLFASFLKPDYQREDLERSWTKLRQLYEQELDRRFYQDKARTGALRDSLLDCFDPFSARTGEFLAMLCYRNFPYLTLDFLEAFTHNHGSNDEARRKQVPFLMWYLSLPEADAAREADQRWIADATERDELRVKTAEEEGERQRIASMGAVIWS